MDLINYLDELKELATMNLTAKDMSGIINKRHNTKFTAKEVSVFLARNNIIYKTTYINNLPKPKKDDVNILWITRNLDRYGNCLVGNSNKMNNINKIINKLKKLNYNINIVITESKSVILEVVK